MPVKFRVPSLSDREHAAVLVHVDETASPVTRMVECLAEAPVPDPVLRPGFYATAAVETRTARAVAVPESALQPGEQGWVAYVVEGDQARLRRLALGLRTRDGFVEVLDGLSEGDVLVVRGGRVLYEGAPVAARSGGAPPASPAPPAAAPKAPSGAGR
jgi:multidrug efflux system membrane fusion protein